MFEKNEMPVHDDTYVDAASSSMFQYDSLKERAQKDFLDFQEWTNNNPDVVADHFDLYERHIVELQKESSFSRRASRFVTRRKHNNEQEYADYFGITNMGQLPSDALLANTQFRGKDGDFSRVPGSFGTFEDAVRYFADNIPGGVPDDLIKWSGGRLDGLYRILPEFVIQNNGMEKVLRTMMGVVALTAAEAVECTEEERSERIEKSILPAYFYAATYPIVDDILQDSDYVSDSKDRSRYHAAMLKGLSSGADISGSELPDHPLAEEMLDIYNQMRTILPFAENRDVYYALESMYLAQHDDAAVVASELSIEADLYVPVMIKASLSRVVALMIAGNAIGPDRSARMLSTLLRQQLVDDHRDIVQDLNGERLTPFTLHINHPELGFTNPLFNRIAQESYISSKVYPFEDSDRIKRSLSKFGAFDMAHSMSGDKAHAQLMRDYFSDQGGLVDNLILIASGLGRSALASSHLSTPDKYLPKLLNEKVPNRSPQSMDPRTYMSDALSYVNETILNELSGDSALDEVMRYSLEAGGKRVRPALTLMLAESLGIARESLEPLLVSSEFAHTASLIFDDLPAQDNAPLRRGKETAHIRFPEYDAQLAGISMIAHSIGVLGRLDSNFPPERVNRVVEYVGSVLGAKKLCLGQHMDLAVSEYLTNEEIIEMYNLKTSTMIEHALVPLMMLAGRSQKEIELIQQYAYHAGIIFQLRDDILDVTSSAEVMGKNGEQDGGKQNIVTTLGVEGAQSTLDAHLRGAVEALSQLAFPTNLLEELVAYFSTRKK